MTKKKVVSKEKNCNSTGNYHKSFNEKNCPKKKKINWPDSEQPKKLGLLGQVLKFLFPSRYR